MSSDIRSFKDLDVWKVGMELAVLCYRVSKQLPVSEWYELSSQIRRASPSVPANVAEGQAAGRTGRFLNHTNIALGSLGELETCLILTTRLELLAPDQIRETLEHVERARASCFTGSRDRCGGDAWSARRRAYRFLRFLRLDTTSFRFLARFCFESW